MYVKVHKKGNQWFREDGTVAGSEVPKGSGYYKYLARIYSSKIFIQTSSGILFVVHRGYLDYNKNFHHLGAYDECSEESVGFYIFN